MQKQFIAVVLLLIIPFVLIYFSSSIKDISQEQMIVNAFYNSQAKILTSIVTFKGELYDNNNDEEVLKEVVDKISNLFKIDPSSMEQAQNSSDTYREHRISGITPSDNYIRARVWSEYDQKTSKTKGYIEIELYHDGLWNHIDEAQKKTEKSLSTYVKESQTTYQITGIYEGKLNDKELEEIRDRILRDSKAKKLYDSEMENVINVFAYSPLYSGYTIPGSQEANLKLSIRYSPYENKTFISMSSPIEIK